MEGGTAAHVSLVSAPVLVRVATPRRSNLASASSTSKSTGAPILVLSHCSTRSSSACSVLGPWATRNAYANTASLASSSNASSSTRRNAPDSLSSVWKYSVRECAFAYSRRRFWYLVYAPMVMPSSVNDPAATSPQPPETMGSSLDRPV